MDTIFSLVTKSINQNVGIIRVSGSETFHLLKKIYPGIKIKKNSATFQKLFDKEKFIDDTIVLIFENPNSFTGEDLIEIQFHGSIFVAKEIINIIESTGLARQSEAGEFTKQAFINNKIDLTQSEAINSIILSENELLTKAATKNLNGFQKNFINKLINKMEDIISRMQVAIDYPENTDLPKYNLKNISEEIKNIILELDIIIINSKKIIKIDKGIKVSIIGRPNAGKSSLFNSLLMEEKAIVSKIKGTTRDVIESNIYFKGVKFLFQDTAGIRKFSNDEIELIGMEKAIEAPRNSDIILFLLDPLENIKEQLGEFDYITKGKTSVIKVITKTDLLNENDLDKFKQFIKISSTKNDLNELEKEISMIMDKQIFEHLDSSNILTTENQYQKFTEINNSLKETISLVEKGYSEDIVFFEIERAMKLLNLILGKQLEPDYLMNLFKNFCIGK